MFVEDCPRFKEKQERRNKENVNFQCEFTQLEIEVFIKMETDSDIEEN